MIITDDMTQAQMLIELRKVLQPPPPPSSLVELVEKYEAKWPMIAYVKGGSRARKAMEIVLRGGLRRTSSDAAGQDQWEVNGHTCSKVGGYCDCKDRVYTDPLYGKLCAHRLAVALKTNWLGDRNPGLTAMLTELRDTYESFALLVERFYEWHNEGQRVTVAGYMLPRRWEPVRMPPEQRIEITLPQFQTSLEAAGLGLTDLPEKLPGWSDYLYHIAKGGAVPCTEAIFYHKGRTWRMEDRERTRRMVLTDIAEHLPEYLNGPLALNLSEYEARRVRDLRMRLEVNHEAAVTVWGALPEALQVAILESYKGVEYAN